MKPVAIGECDACPKVEDLFEIIGSKMRLCGKCYQAELAAIESSKVINNVVATSLKQDASVQLKADIFNAATMSFGELHTAIQHDDSIPAEKKNETLVNLVKDRITAFSQVIFDLSEQKIAKENEREGWRKATVDFIAKLRAEEREKYSKFNISYTPAPVTKTKVTKAAGTGSGAGKKRKATGFSTAEMTEIKAAAAKYNVPMASIQMIAKAQNLSIEAAAQQMASIVASKK